MQGTYSPALVVVSLLVAMLASYTVLDLTAFISFLERRAIQRAWLAGGAVAMGVGIWSMHFVGMLAFSLPIPIGFDLLLTLASLAIAIVFSYIGLSVAIRPDMTRLRLVVGGILLGGGVASMHYSGMAAMRMTPGIHYHPGLVTLSIIIAVVAATAALWIARALSAPSRRDLLAKRIGASAIMGVAIVGMHYTGMAAAEFVPGTICLAARGHSTQLLALMVTGGTLAVLLATLVAARYDAHSFFLRKMSETFDRRIANLGPPPGTPERRGQHRPRDGQ